MRSLKQKTDGASRSSAQIENIKRQSLHYLERQDSRRHDPSPHSLPPLVQGQRRRRVEGLPRAEGLPADGAGVRQQSGTGLDDELSPWPADGVWKGQAPYKGLAAEHLRWMMEECVPQVGRKSAGSYGTHRAVRQMEIRAHADLMPMREVRVRPTMPVRRIVRTLRTAPLSDSSLSSPVTPSRVSSPSGPPGTQGISGGSQASQAPSGIRDSRIISGTMSRRAAAVKRAARKRHISPSATGRAAPAIR